MKQPFVKLRKLAIIASASAALTTSAQDLSYTQALNIANDFFASHGISCSEAMIQRAKSAEPAATGNSAYYIINTDGAFAVVAGDSRIEPILAYSLDAPFDADNIAPGAADMLAGYEAYVKAVANGEVKPPAQRRVNYGAGCLIPTATWAQSSSPWWDDCPMDGYSHTYAGCAATAMSILMKHHGWPATTGRDSKTYNYRYNPSAVTNGTVSQAEYDKYNITVDFGASTYYINDIPMEGEYASTWSSDIKAKTSNLLFHAGVAANMAYDTSGSGTTTFHTFVGMCHYFRYKMGGMVNKWEISDIDDYMQLIIDEINAGYPLPYSGFNSNGGGHIFICDGYDGYGCLHFNFGWAGGQNGYYYIVDTAPAADDHGYLSFYDAQCAIVGTRPDRNDEAIPTFYMPYVSDESALTISQTTIHRGESFCISLKNIIRTCDVPTVAGYGFKIVGADGTVKADLYEASGTHSGVAVLSTSTPPLTIPVSYEYAPGDKICVYYSPDGSSWQPMPCYVEGSNSLDLADYYDSAISVDMTMTTIEQQCKGLTIKDGNSISKGSDFIACINYLWNTSRVTFNGTLAIFVCDDEGNMRQKVGEVQNFSLGSSRYTTLPQEITCNIPVDLKLNSGDRLIAFSQYSGDNSWTALKCDVEANRYILIPDELIDTDTPAETTETVSFTTLMATFSSTYDIDFSSATSFNAFKLIQQDRETLILQRIDKLKAGEGALLWGQNLIEGKYTDTVTHTEGAPSHAGNLLIGVDSDTVISNDDTSATNYVFKATDSEMGFYIAGGETVKAGQAYMRLSGHPMNAPARFTFIVQDDLSGIMSVTCDAPVVGKIYNMQGIEVTHPTNGIYIINGKKVIIRM